MKGCKTLSLLLLAAGLAVSPVTAVAANDNLALSLDNLSLALELGGTAKTVDSTTSVSAFARQFPFVGTETLRIDSSVDDLELSEVLVRVSYRFNDQFTPYLLFGGASLSFDDEYTVAAADLNADLTVPYEDAGAPVFGFGAEGTLLTLPAEVRLGYGMRMITFSSDDSASVTVPAVAARFPFVDPEFSTDVDYTEWDFSLGVSRAFALSGDFSITPQLGYRHASITVDATTDVEYVLSGDEGLEATFERSIGGSLGSLTLGVAADYRRALGAAIEVVLGEESGGRLLLSFSF